MTLPPASTWFFAVWVLTAALATPLFLGAILGSRFARAQRGIARTALFAAPVILVAGLLLPDPFGGRPLLRFGGPAEVVSEGVEPAPKYAPSIEAPPIGTPQIGTPQIGTPQNSIAEALEVPPLRFDHRVDHRIDPPQIPHPSAEPDTKPFLDLHRELAVTPPNHHSPSWTRSLTRSPAQERALDPIRHPTAAVMPAPDATLLRAQPAMPTRAAAAAPTVPVIPAASRLELRGVVRGLLFVWLTGVIVGLIRLAGGMVCLARLRRTAIAVGSTRGVPLIDPELAPLPVRIIPGLRGAAAVGVLSPEIWLPARWSARLDPRSLHTLLGHEAAHHRERDPLVRIASAAVVALLWPHPFVHFLRRREETLSELVADRRVLAAGAGSRRYAELLTRLAAEASGAHLALASGVFGTRSPLERRIRMILSTPADRAKRDGGWAAPALLGLICSAALGLSVCFPLVGDACDPEDEPATQVEVVLEKQDGWWQLSGRSRAEDNALLWLTRLASSDEGSAVLKRNGRFARVSVGDRDLLLDTSDGHIIASPARGIQVRSSDEYFDLLGENTDEPVRDGAARDSDLARLNDSIVRLEQELEAREEELENLEQEYEDRSDSFEDEAEELGDRIEDELERAEEEIEQEQEQLKEAERAMRRSPADERASLRVEIAAQRAQLARQAAELRAQHQDQLARLHVRLADDRRNIGRAASERMHEQLAQIGTLRDRLATEYRALAESRRDGRDGRDVRDGDAAGFRRLEPRSARDAERAIAEGRMEDAAEYFRKALEFQRRDGQHDGSEDSEMDEEMHEHSADSLSEVLHDAIAELHETMEQMHEDLEGLNEHFEGLPQMLEGLHQLRQLGTLGELHVLGNRDRGNERVRELELELADERDRRATLEAENADLRKLVEQLKKKKGAETIR